MASQTIAQLATEWHDRQWQDPDELSRRLARRLKTTRHSSVRLALHLLLAELAHEQGAERREQHHLAVAGVLPTGWSIQSGTQRRAITLHPPAGRIPVESLLGPDHPGGEVVLERPLMARTATTWAFDAPGVVSLYAVDRTGVRTKVRAVDGEYPVRRGNHVLRVALGQRPPRYVRIRRRTTAQAVAAERAAFDAWDTAPASSNDRARVNWVFKAATPSPASLDRLESTADAALFAADTDIRSHRALRRLRAARLAPGLSVTQRHRLDLAIARWHQDRGQTLTALDSVRNVLTRVAAPSEIHLRARVLEAHILSELDLTGSALAIGKELRAHYPRVPAAHRTLANAYMRRGLNERAHDAWSVLARADGPALGDPFGEALYYQHELARDRGDARVSRRTAEALVRRQATGPGHRVLALRTYEVLGDTRAARQQAEEVARLYPYDSDALTEAARFHRRQGDFELAATLFSRALRVRPHQPEVRDTLRALSGADTPHPMRWPLDLDSLLDTPSHLPSGSGPAIEGLTTDRVTELFEDGTTSTWVRHVARVRRIDPDQLPAWSVVFDPSRQSVNVLSTRRLAPDGEVFDDADRQEVDLSERWYRLYYERRAARIRFDKVAAGDVLVIEYRLDDDDRSLYDGMYSAVIPIQDESPQHRVRLRWVTPADRSVHVRIYGAEAQQETRQLDDGRRVFSLQTAPLPAVRSEPGMPGMTESGAWVHATTHDSWSAVADWYRELVAQPRQLTPELEARARTIVHTLMTPEAKVDALYDFVARSIRYVGLEFGEHGFKPYPADEVLRRRFGDCKDQTLLLHVLLKAVGIDSQFTLVRTRRHGRVPNSATSPAVFDHAMLYVPDIDRFLDPTVPNASSRELPAAVLGGSALVIGQTDQRFVHIPAGTADDHRVDRRLDLEWSDERIDISGRLSASGSSAAALRENVGALHPERLTVFVEREAVGLRITDIDHDLSVDTPTPSVRYRGYRTVHNVLPLFGRGLSLADLVAPKGDRTQDFALDHPVTWRWRFRVRDRRGSPLWGPKPDRLESRFGRFDLSTRPIDDGLEVQVTIALESDRVTAGEYDAFRDFLVSADAVLHQASIRRLW